MNKTETFLKLWDIIEISEKQRIMRQFIQLYGDHYNQDDFINFLVERYEGSHLNHQPRDKFNREN